MSGALLGLVVAAGLWPFGAGPKSTEPTIGSLTKHAPVAEAAPAVADGAAAARENYRAFLELNGTRPDMRADAMRRLGDLYLATGEIADQAGDAAASAAGYAEAARLYRQYLAEFPGRGDTDRVLYALSRAQESLGRADEALATLDELVTRFPRSAYLAEAQFRRAERLFVMHRYPEAERAYAAVVSQGEASGFQVQALYKQGWSLYKQGLHEESLDPFLDVLARTVPAQPGAGGEPLLESLPKPQRELVDDTLRAMSLSVSQLDGIRGIDALLDRRGPVAFSDLVYGGLGDLYLAQERYGDAADAFHGFVAREAYHPRAPYLQARVIHAYAAGRFPSKVLAAEGEYVRLYGLDTPYWQGVAPGTRPEVVRHLKESLGDLASYDHALAQKSHAREDWQRAADWYRRFLAYFPEDAESPRRNFLLAETLNESGDYAGATAEFQRTAYQYPAHPQSAEAGYAALLAAREHEKRLADADRAAWHAATTEDGLRFAHTFPDHPQAAPVATSVAQELYRQGDLPRAIAVAGEVAARVPPAAPELDRAAWTVMAQARFDLGRYAEAEQAYAHLIALGGTDAKGRAALEERLAAAVYRQAEVHRDAGETDAAVADFLRVADVAPAAGIRPNALLDAAALLGTSRQWDRAVETLQRFRREFPGHTFTADVNQQLAVALMESGRSGESAVEFEGIAGQKGTAPDVQREALWRAADLYAKAGRVPEQQRVYEEIVTRFPAPFPEAMEARARLLDLARARGDEAARRRWLEAIVAADAGAGAARTDRSRTLAAHAALDLAAPERDAFVAQRLTVPLPASLKAKKKRMESALAAYARASAYDVADVTTASTYETAELYYRLSRDLLESERPPKLGKDELEQYQLLLEEQAFPFEEKALQIHAANAARAAQGVYDQSVRGSFARLAEMNPARYARQERTESYVAELD